MSDSTTWTEAACSAIVPAPAAAVWSYFDWPNLARMLGGGFFVDVHYDEPRAIAGATRVVTITGGARLTEVLERCDGDRMCFEYRILDNDALPVRDYAGRVTVVAETADRTRVDFACRCRRVGIEADAWQAAYAGMQAGFIEYIRGQLAPTRTPSSGARVLAPSAELKPGSCSA